MQQFVLASLHLNDCKGKLQACLFFVKKSSPRLFIKIELGSYALLVFLLEREMLAFFFAPFIILGWSLAFSQNLRVSRGGW